MFKIIKPFLVCLILALPFLSQAQEPITRLDLITDNSDEYPHITVAPKDSAFFEQYWNGLDDNGYRLKAKLKNGVYYVYLDSSLLYTAFYKSMKRNGTWEYYSRKQIHHRVNYKNGLKHGTEIMYNQEGTIIQTGQNKKGIPVGTWIGYDEEGKNIVAKFYHKKGMERRYEQFHANGKLKSVTEYDEEGSITTKKKYDVNGIEIKDP